ncbi:MAG: choline/ethanolamine kinase family protein [Porticoccaceae bacterium]
MMSELPEQSLVRALESWPQWNLSLANKPRVVKALSGGLTNRNYLLNVDLRDKGLLETEACLLVLRVNSPASHLLGIDRVREQHILGSLAGPRAPGKGLAPKIVYCNSDDGLLVTEYIEGRHWQVEELKDPSKLKKLLRVFKQVGEIQAGKVRDDFPEFDYRAHIEHYWRGLQSAGSKDKNLATRFEKSKIAVEQLSEINRDKPRVLCHHDLSPLNVIETLRGELVLLDWEYAGGGWPVMDYVALIRNWQLYKSQALILNTLNNNNGVEFANVDFTTVEVKAAHQVWAFIDSAWHSLNTPLA